MGDDWLWSHLAEVPAHRALIRATEARLFSRLTLVPPVLDVGCGDGHFAAVAFGQPLDAGLDVARPEVAEAARRGGYRLAVVARGEALPWPEAHFATAISNCVLEHIPDVDAVLAEVGRVLRPGGQFVFSVPSQHFAEWLFWPTVLRRLGLHGLAGRYGRWFNRISRHYHCDARPVWEARLARAGFAVVDWQPYFSPATHRAFDLSHYYAAPTLLYKRLLGRWVLCPWPASLWPVERWLRPHYAEPPPAEGAYHFFVCRKG